MFYWFGYDIMGELVYSKSFNMLRDRKWHHVVKRSQKAVSLLGPLSPVPWAIQIGLRVCPSVWMIKDWRFMTTWCQDLLSERLANGCAEDQPDFTSYLLSSDGTTKPADHSKWSYGDNMLAMVAGRSVTIHVPIR